MSGLRLLVTGGSGQVGGALAALGTARGHTIDLPPRAAFDLADPAGMTAYLAGRRFDAIINCAAYTVVDAAEAAPDAAFAANAAAPGVLARIAGEQDIPLLHVSTDYVFDGTKAGPYGEDDATGPISVYGASKLAGEAAIIASGCRHAILRTAWVLSAGGKNFLNTMLRLGAEREELSVVADQHGCPTSADDIAAALLAMADAMVGRSAGSGVWHFVNSGETTWHGLAAHIFARAGAAGLKTPRLLPITTAQYPTPARRPANSVLATDKFARDFYAPRGWQAAIDAILDQRLKG